MYIHICIQCLRPTAATALWGGWMLLAIPCLCRAGLGVVGWGGVGGSGGGDLGWGRVWGGLGRGFGVGWGSGAGRGGVAICGGVGWRGGYAALAYAALALCGGEAALAYAARESKT